jgi:hypothetical protein
MNKRSAGIEKTSVESLIESEEKAGLARFRSGDFEADVRKRIEATATRKGDIPAARQLPRPAWLVVAGCVLAAGLALVFLLPTSPRPDIARTIEKALAQGTEIQALWDVTSKQAQAGDELAPLPNKTIMTAVTYLIQNASLEKNPASAPSPAGSKPAVRPLGLEGIYKILIIDKSVERVLAFLSS